MKYLIKQAGSEQVGYEVKGNKVYKVTYLSQPGMDMQTLREEVRDFSTKEAIKRQLKLPDMVQFKKLSAAKSKAQQKFMGMVHAYQKGELKASEVSKEVIDAAKSMTYKEAKTFASTKRKGLPEHKKTAELNMYFNKEANLLFKEAKKKCKKNMAKKAAIQQATMKAMGQLRRSESIINTALADQSKGHKLTQEVLNQFTRAKTTKRAAEKQLKDITRKAKYMA